MNSQEKYQYRLEVLKKAQIPMKIDVGDSISVGSDPRSDLVIIGKKILPKHLLFAIKGENLALHYFGNSGQCFLNHLPLEEGKTFLLESGDKIELEDTEIRILFEKVHFHESQKLKTVILTEKIAPVVIPEIPSHGITKEKKAIKGPTLASRFDLKYFFYLWQIKILSLIFDFFLTYILLVIVLPVFFLRPYAQELTRALAYYLPILENHSFLSYLIFVYLFTLTQSLLFGTTLGQFMAGLRIRSENKFSNLFLYRLKTFFLSLFLIPAQNFVSQKLFFKIIRKTSLIFFIIAIASPLFLPLPYNLLLTEVDSLPGAPKELRTRSLYSNSTLMKISLAAEISPRYFLLPFVSKVTKKRGFQFVDLKTNQTLSAIEKITYDYTELEKKLAYANPFYSWPHQKKIQALPFLDKKSLLTEILKLGHNHWIGLAKANQGFIGSSVLLKKDLILGLDTSDVIVKFYKPESPMIFIGSGKKSFFYLFGNQSISLFEIDTLNVGQLLHAFEEQVISKFITPSPDSIGLSRQDVGLLEAFDAILQNDEQTFLTYYIATANSLEKLKDVNIEGNYIQEAATALINNIRTVKVHIKNKNVEKSFTDIIDQLTPMENPGAKR